MQHVIESGGSWNWSKLTWYVPPVESNREIKMSRSGDPLHRVSPSVPLIVSIIEDPDTLERGLVGRSVK
jgi:hypothetical protein